MRFWVVNLVVLILVSRIWSQPNLVQNNQSDQDEKILRDHQLATDGGSLVRFLRERTLSKAQQEKLADKIQQLGNESYMIRSQAAADLVKAGELARPLLLEAIRNPGSNLEITRRAELCLRQIQGNYEGPLVLAVIHLLAQRRPAEAAVVLVDYLPFATHAELVEAVQSSLNQLAVREGKPEPALLQAIKNHHPGQRAVAAEALIRGGGLTLKPLVEPLLRDSQPRVRMQLAMALVDKQDRAAVPELIQVLPLLSPDQTWPVEDLLHRLAGDKGPNAWIGADFPAIKAQGLWQAWWKQNQEKVDLAQIHQVPPTLGFTLIAHLGNGATGRVLELGPGKEIRWQIDTLRYPVDAQIVGNDRVLIAEYMGQRVTERDFKGQILWEKSIPLPITCQRIAGGKTFIATRRQLLIVDQQGKEVFTFHPQNTSIAAATYARDGQIFLVYTGGQLQILDREGRERKSFTVGPVYGMGSNLEVLSQGRILLPQYRDNKVVEYDSQGKVVWETQVNLPVSATRLGNGNTLVTSAQQKILEINRQGQVVWEYSVESRAFRARRR